MTKPKFIPQNGTNPVRFKSATPARVGDHDGTPWRLYEVFTARGEERAFFPDLSLFDELDRLLPHSLDLVIEMSVRTDGTRRVVVKTRREAELETGVRSNANGHAANGHTAPGSANGKTSANGQASHIKEPRPLASALGNAIAETAEAETAEDGFPVLDAPMQTILRVYCSFFLHARHRLQIDDKVAHSAAATCSIEYFKQQRDSITAKLEGVGNSETESGKGGAV